MTQNYGMIICNGCSRLAVINYGCIADSEHGTTPRNHKKMVLSSRFVLDWVLRRCRVVCVGGWVRTIIGHTGTTGRFVWRVALECHKSRGTCGASVRQYMLGTQPSPRSFTL